MQSILEQLTASLERLSALLHDEAERLRQQNIEGLDQLLSQKLEALQAVEALDGRRRDLLSQAGFSADETGMRDYMHQYEPALQGSWEAILASLQQLQALNEANGRIIHRGLEQTGQMLALLRGDDSPDASTYGPGGHQARGGGGTLTRA